MYIIDCGSSLIDDRDRDRRNCLLENATSSWIVASNGPRRCRNVQSERLNWILVFKCFNFLNVFLRDTDNNGDFPFLPSSFYALLITTESTFRLFPGYILLRQQHPQQLFFSSSFPFLSRHVSRIYLSYSRILYIYSWTHSFTHSRAHWPDVNSTPSSSSFPILSQINHKHRYHY